jgi:hypothetical protein
MLVNPGFQSSAEPPSTNATQTQIKTIRDALSQMDRDLEDFHKTRAILLANLPAAAEPGAPAVTMDMLVSNGRKSLEVESNLVQLVKDYSAKCMSHFPQIRDLEPQIQRFADLDNALKLNAKRILPVEREELDVLTQMLQAHNSRDVKACDALKAKYGALQIRSKDLTNDGKNIAGWQEGILAEVKSMLEGNIKTIQAGTGAF